MKEDDWEMLADVVGTNGNEDEKTEAVLVHLL